VGGTSSPGIAAPQGVAIRRAPRGARTLRGVTRAQAVQWPEVAVVRAELAAVEPARIHREFARREAFCRWPVHGNVLEALLAGRLEIGPQVLFEPGVWITCPGEARIRIGGGTFLNLGVQVASVELVENRAALHVRQRLLRDRWQPPVRRPTRPVPWQGFTTKGPTRVGDNVWCGANVVVTSGVTVGDRCVIGANSVVTPTCRRSHRRRPPAKVLRTITYPERARGPPAR
jgi:acetyltransferase-like isoleucine patch superfamily enzyme